MAVTAEADKVYESKHGQRINIIAEATTTFQVSFDQSNWVNISLADLPGFYKIDIGKAFFRFPVVGSPAAQFEIGPTEM